MDNKLQSGPEKIAQKIAQSLLRHHFATVCSTDSCGYHQNAQ